MDNRQGGVGLSFELRVIVGEFISDYYSASPKTQRIYTDNIERVLCSYLETRGVTDLLKVTPQVLREYLIHESERTYTIGSYTRKQSPTTVNKRYESAKTFFGWCVAQEYLGSNPMLKVKRPKMPSRFRVGYSKDEVKRLVEAAAKAPGWLAARDRAILLMLLGTGARASELTGMHMDCVQWTVPRPRPGGPPQRTRYLTLHGKGGKDRRVPLGATAFGALRDYMAIRPPTHHTNVWLTQRGTPFNAGALNQMMVNLRDYSDVAGVTPHRFRHTYATAWYRQHRDIMALKNLLGHSKVETTQRYLASLGADYGLQEDYSTPDTYLLERKVS